MNVRMTSSPRASSVETLPPIYRVDQLLTEAAYRRHRENQKLLAQMMAFAAFAGMLGLLLVLGPSLAQLLSGLLTGALDGSAQTSGG